MLCNMLMSGEGLLKGQLKALLAYGPRLKLILIIAGESGFLNVLGKLEGFGELLDEITKVNFVNNPGKEVLQKSRCTLKNLFVAFVQAHGPLAAGLAECTGEKVCCLRRT